MGFYPLPSPVGSSWLRLLPSSRRRFPPLVGFAAVVIGRSPPSLYSSSSAVFVSPPHLKGQAARGRLTPQPSSGHRTSGSGACPLLLLFRGRRPSLPRLTSTCLGENQRCSFQFRFFFRLFSFSSIRSFSAARRSSACLGFSAGRAAALAGTCPLAASLGQCRCLFLAFPSLVTQR